ncbi:MAG: YidC/Oxa1 family membrane protein insertase [Clostridia bacterium]|nr:YidC/Oxa1 family membrane protein insertase [Clostridia bacterium]
MLQSLLAVPIYVLEYGYKIGLDWLGKFAQAIIEGVGIIGLGIIVFTIVLKCITLPFDIYQRVNMRKQNLVMQEMQPELEKLQKQYANDKTTYNQKMMELYKKNGYSMLGACLPTIISLVILIVAFQGFRTYSQYANLSMYEQMSQVYTEAILEYAPDGHDFGEGRNYFILAGEDEEENLSEGKIKWENDRTVDGALIGAEGITYRFYLNSETAKDEEGNETVLEHKYVEVVSSAPDKFIKYNYWIEEKPSAKFNYYVDTTKLETYLEGENAEYYATLKETVTLELTGKVKEEELNKEVERVSVGRYVVHIGAKAAAEWYRDGNSAGFLWVKNVWYPDVSYNHPIQSYSKFKSQLNKNVTLQDGTKKSLVNVLDKDNYNYLISELDKEQKQPNGYFVLIILSIGFMVLSQFISMRSSKTSNKYQTVDGQGARTQKVMLVVMPIIYAIFAFMYSAAFSIYMTMSSIISLLTTVFANLIIGAVFKKKSKKKAEARVTRKYAWQMTEKEKREKEKEAQKEAKMKERANRFKRK